MPENEQNPYSPPKSDPTLRETGRSELRVHGNVIIAATPVKLPFRCIRTSASGEKIMRTRKSLSWIGPGSPGKCRVDYSVSPVTHTLMGVIPGICLIGVIASVVMIINGIFLLRTQSTDLPTLFLGIGILTASLYFNHRFMPIRVVRFKDGHFHLKGFSKAYLEELSKDLGATP